MTQPEIIKKKIMLIAGCSHVAGSEIDGTEDSLYNRDNSFGNVLAKTLGYEPYNIALNGATNSGIARSILHWFKNYYNPEEMDVGVVIGWTESTRVEVPSNRIAGYDASSKFPAWFDNTCKRFYRINLGYEGWDAEEKEITKYFHKFIVNNGSFMEMMTANWVLQLQYFLSMHQIKYVMCNTLHVFTLPNKHVEMYTDLIDKTKYMDWNNNENCFFWKYRNSGYDNPKAKYWHHNEVPHRLYAGELYNFIEANKCF